ncbi:hypothetical protein BJV78DRAFT_1285698 [Lactifluus subvellereus]|nr:hypothetical protein BJV78DRAFT_1285698 [Lactifluus subvellereus]
MSSSLFMSLTELPNEGYTATEVIKYLIDVVGHDVVSFRRNAHVSYMLVDRARDICNAINDYIQGAESERDWTSFEKFTNAIDPVEDALFQLIAFTEDEKGRHLASGNSVEDCVASAEHWATNREQIWSTLDVLETRTELMELFSGLNVSSRQADRLDARKYDDKTFFEEVIADINDTLARFQRYAIEMDAVKFRLILARLPPFLRKLHTKLDRLFTKMATGSISPVTLSLSLHPHKSDAPNGIVDLSLISTSIDVATRNHLRSTPVWDAAKDLVELLILTNSDDKASIDKIRFKYDAFLRLLRNIKGLQLPKSYIEVIKQAGKVRRPFHSQAVTLILLCRVLATEFGKERHHTAENALSLEVTCNETLKALKEAVAAVTELKIFDTVDLEDHPAYKALVVAQNHIKGCFNAFGLNSDWNEKEQLISDAVRKDKERMEVLNKALATRPPLTVHERPAQVKVTVSVMDRTTAGPRVVGHVTFDVESSTRLSAVRWTVAGGLDEQLARRARQDGEFRFGPDDRPCELHNRVSDLSELTNSNKECVLKLII